jgi:hypothetical protein
LNWTISAAYDRLPWNASAPLPPGGMVTLYQCNASAEAWLHGIVARPLGNFALPVGGIGPVHTMETTSCLNTVDGASSSVDVNASECILWGTDFVCGRHPSPVLSGFAVASTPTPPPGPPPLSVQTLPHPAPAGSLLNAVLIGGRGGVRVGQHSRPDISGREALAAAGPSLTTRADGGGGFIVSHNTSQLRADGGFFNFTVQGRDQYGSCAQGDLAPWSDSSMFNITLTATVQCNLDQSVIAPIVECCSPQVPLQQLVAGDPPPSPAGRDFPIDSISGCGANFSGAIAVKSPKQQLFAGAYCVLQINMLLEPRQAAPDAASFRYPMAVGNYTIMPGTAFEATQNILIIVICTVLGVLALAIVARRAARRTVGAITTFDAEQDFDGDRRGVLSADGSYVSAAETSRQASDRDAVQHARHAGKVRACHCLWLPLWLVRCRCGWCKSSKRHAQHQQGGQHPSWTFQGGDGGGARSGRKRSPSWPPVQPSRATLLREGSEQGQT